MKKQNEVKDRVYKLKNNMKPLSYILQSRNIRRYPLLWYDLENNVNRPLRYASNQQSPFEDEQDGNAILEPIVFTDGMLIVPRSNPVLQKFLSYHPQNGSIFEEVDNERDASKELENITNEVDALIRAKELSLEQLEQVYRVLFNVDVSRVTTAEMKRDVLVYAKTKPQAFMAAIEDPLLKMQARVHVLFDKGLLAFRKGNKEVWYNTSTNKTKMLSVPYGEDPYYMVAVFLKSDEGIDALKMLEHHAANI